MTPEPEQLPPKPSHLKRVWTWTVALSLLLGVVSLYLGWQSIRPWWHRNFRSDPLAPVRVSSRYGFIDRFGVMVLPPIYESAHSFDENGLAVVKYGDCYGAIDRQGNIQIPFEYQFLSPPRPVTGLLLASRTGKSGWINRENRIVIPLQYDAVISGDFRRSSNAVVLSNGLMGMVDQHGKEVIPCKYDILDEEFDHGFLRGKRGNSSAIINRQGIEIVPPRYSVVRQSFRSGGRSALISFVVEQSGKQGLYDSTGRCVVPCEYDNVGFMSSNGLVRVSNQQGVGFIDSTGKIAIPLQWDEAFQFGCFSNPNITIVSKGDTKHVIDQTGKILLTRQD